MPSQEVFKVIDDWFDYYNNDRPIWGLDKRTPVEYYLYPKSGGKVVTHKKKKKKGQRPRATLRGMGLYPSFHSNALVK